MTTRGRKKSIRAITYALLLAFLLPPLVPAFAEPGHFSQSEFPNLFLPREYWNTAPERIPPDVVAAARDRMERALGSVFRRLEIPIVPEGETAPRPVRYFQYVQDRLRRIDPGVQVMPSGGVVRSAVGYLYAEMYRQWQENPTADPLRILESIIRAEEAIPGHRIRGIGSDFDILLRHSGTHFTRLQEEAVRITNSAETHFHMRNVRGGIKRAVFTVGDVKDYDVQIRRSTIQGGATIDFLAYDIDGRVFVQPSTHREIVDQMVRGVYQYLPPAPGNSAEESMKQTIRGMRALIELPFLQIQDPTRFMEELQTMIDRIESGVPIDAKALEQFDKAVRNARFSGAHNRLRRGGPGTVEARISRLLTTIEDRISRSTVPEFVDSFPLHNRRRLGDGLNGLPERLLMDPATFRANHTHNGSLFHGTPSIEQGLAILRGGMFVSKRDGLVRGTQRTRAAYERGGYTSGDRSVAMGYAGADGIVFELPVRTDRPIHVLDWQAVKDTPEMQAIQARATRENRDVFEVLARDHGIDIIINGHVLIQNIDALVMPSDVRDVIHAYGSVMDNPHAAAKTRVSAYATYTQLHAYASAMGDRTVSPPPELEAFVRLLLRQSSDKVAAFDALFRHLLLGPDALDIVRNDPALRATWLDALSRRLGISDAERAKQAREHVFRFVDPRASAAALAVFRSAWHQVRDRATTWEALREALGKYQITWPGSAAGHGDAPRDIVALSQWLSRIALDTAARPADRIDAYNAHRRLSPIHVAETGDRTVAALPNEQDFLLRLTSVRERRLEAFEQLLQSSRLGDLVRERIESNPAFRRRWLDAIREGLTSANLDDRLRAVDAITKHVPSHWTEFPELERLSMVARASLRLDTPVEHFTHTFLWNQDNVHRILFSNDPAWTRYRGLVFEAIERPYTSELDIQILRTILGNFEEFQRRFPGRVALVLRRLRNWDAGNVSWEHPFNAHPEFEAALRRHLPDLWRAKMLQMLSNGTLAAGFHWNLRDPEHASLLREAAARAGLGNEYRVRLWAERVKRSHPETYALIASHINGPWAGEQVRRAVDLLPDARLRREYESLRAGSDYHWGFGATAFGLADRNLPALAEALLVPGGPSLPAETYGHLWNDRRYRDRLIAHFREDSPERAYALLEWLSGSYGGERLGARSKLLDAVRADPRWRERLRAFLLSDASDPGHWRAYPWNLRSPQDVELLRTVADRLEHAQRQALNGPVSLQDSRARARWSVVGRVLLEVIAPGNATPHRELQRLRSILVMGQTEPLTEARIAGHIAQGTLAGVRILRNLRAFPWSLENDAHVRALRELDARDRHVAAELEALEEEIKRRFGERATDLSYRWMEMLYSGNGELGRDIPDAALRARWLDLLRRMANRAAIDEVLTPLARRDPLGFHARFGEHPLLELGHDLTGSPFAAVLRKLEEGTPLSASDRAVLRFFLDRNDTHAIERLVRTSGESRRLGLEAALHVGRTDPARLFYMLDIYSNADFGEHVRDAVTADRPLAAALLSAIRDGRVPVEHAQHYPWDISRPQHRRFLLELARQAVDPATVPDGPATRGEKIYDMFFGSYDLLHRLSKSLPGADFQRFLVEVESASGLRWDRPRDLLPRPTEAAAVAGWLELGLSLNHSDDYLALLSDHRTREAMERRLTELRPHDSAQAVARVVAALRSRNPELYRRIRRQPGFLAALESALARDADLNDVRYSTGPAAHESPASTYPWDLRDEHDRRRLQERERATSSAVHDEWSRLLEEVKIRTGSELHRLGSRDLPPDLAARLRVLLPRITERLAVEHQIGLLATSDPAQYARLFPSDTVLPWRTTYHFSGEGREGFGFSGNHLRLHGKLLAKQPLTAPERALFRRYLRLAHPDFLVLALNAAPEIVTETLRYLSESGSPAALALIGNRDGRYRREAAYAITEALKNDEPWRRRLVDALAEHVEYAATIPQFPWDRSSAHDRLALERMAQGVTEQAPAQLFAFLRRMRAEHGIALPAATAPTDLPPEIFPTTALRTEYLRLVRNVHVESEHLASVRRNANCAGYLGGIADEALWPLPH